MATTDRPTYDVQSPENQRIRAEAAAKAEAKADAYKRGQEAVRTAGTAAVGAALALTGRDWDTMSADERMAYEQGVELALVMQWITTHGDEIPDAFGLGDGWAGGLWYDAARLSQLRDFGACDFVMHVDEGFNFKSFEVVVCEGWDAMKREDIDAMFASHKALDYGLQYLAR